MEKLNGYYQRSAESDTHIMAMGNRPSLHVSHSLTFCVIVLDPLKKMSHFCKYWPSHLVSDIEAVVQTRVRNNSLNTLFTESDTYSI